jgi:hypothetical protein
MTAARLVALAVCALATAGCVAPAPDTSAYESKAAMTAEAAVSAARTAVVASDAYRRDRLAGTYLEPVLVDAEEALGSARTTFDSVQPPPTGEADALRSTLDPLLESAGSALTDLRIAARRDRSDDLSTAVTELTEATDRLDAFAEEHR